MAKTSNLNYRITEQTNGRLNAITKEAKKTRAEVIESLIDNTTPEDFLILELKNKAQEVLSQVTNIQAKIIITNFLKELDK